MRLARWGWAAAFAVCLSSPGWAQAIERESAAGRPNEAGALPESRSILETPETVTIYEAQPAPPAAPDFPVDLAAERFRLPATASPLAVVTLSGLMALAAGGGLYRLRREH